jgi:phosphomannomutase
MVEEKYTGMVPSSMKYIFDVDGTLTPSRGEMDPEFAYFFSIWMQDKEVYLATGSDYPKTSEQVPAYILNSCEKIYCCAGNSIWSKGEEIATSSWKLPDECHEFLDHYLDTSIFPLRTGMHFDHRPGLCNFSIIGRGCSPQQRKQYEAHDRNSHERVKIAEAFNWLFADIHAQVAGATGIDIMPKGKDKAQIADQLTGPIVFYGDKMDPGGNDYTLAVEVAKRENSVSIMVKDWEETYAYLHG